jgi:hypothetical protein
MATNRTPSTTALIVAHLYGWVVGLILVVFFGVAGVQIAYVNAHPEKGFVFTEGQSALWAGLLLTLFFLIVDWFVRAVQDEVVDAPTARLAEGRQVVDPTSPDVNAEVVRRSRRRGIKSLVIGVDARASTSKLQAVLWTGAVLYVLTMLLLAGRVLATASDCVPPGGDANAATVCSQPEATALHGVFDDVVKQNLQAEYFALLGIPLGAAVAAKALTTAKVANDDVVKPAATSIGIVTGAGEVVTDDSGNVDVLDAQYALFNLLLLLYFFVAFFEHPENGLPSLPATLLALAGVSGATYLTKKALERDVGPQITAVSPSRIILTSDSKLDVIGTGFVTKLGAATELNRVLLDGRELDVSTWAPDRVVATLPQGTAAEAKAKGFRERTDPTALAAVVVHDDFGRPSAPAPVAVEFPD